LLFDVPLLSAGILLIEEQFLPAKAEANSNNPQNYGLF